MRVESPCSNLYNLPGQGNSINRLELNLKVLLFLYFLGVKITAK